MQVYIQSAILLILLAAQAHGRDWAIQAEADAKEDRRTLIFDGQSPNRLACDTTLREMPDGSWITIMLGGGDKEPLPENRIWISRSQDQGQTWSKMTPVDLGFKKQNPNTALVPTELMVHNGICTLYFATHDGHFGNWKSWYVSSVDSCHTWRTVIPAPGKLYKSTFIRNHIITKDGRILLPFQHYEGTSGPHDPRNGVLISHDDGQTWDIHGWIRLTDDDTYRGWAENNIVELSNGLIAMLIRADKLGGVLYRADSIDGGKTWPSLASKTEIPNPGSKATLYPLGGSRFALLHNPNPHERNPLALWISFDDMKSWPYQRVLDDTPGRLNYPDGFVSKDRQYLHFAFDDNRHRAVYIGAKLPGAETVPLFTDTAFQHGFLLSATDSSLGRKIADRLTFSEEGNQSVWRACQWGTRHDLSGEACQTSESGDRFYSNDAKTILVGGSGSDNRDLILRVNGGVEYGPTPRRQGEAWPHLLVEQDAQYKFRLSELERVDLQIALQLLEFTDRMAGQANPGLHAAQFQLFLIVKNLNPDSQDYNDFFWFGVPFFDNRHPFPPSYRAKDTGKEDATGKFINTIPGEEILHDPLQTGHWVQIQKDLLPYIHEGLQASTQAGFLSDTDPRDYAIVNMNMGWEMPGTYDAAMQIRDFSILAYTID